MNAHVHWLLEVDVKDGQIGAFKALMEEMVAATQADEPGTLNYEWFFNDGETVCHIYERYADSAATMVHMGNFGSKFAQRFLSMVTPTRFSLYGAPDDTVREALSGLAPQFY
mgnify:FL=1